MAKERRIKHDNLTHEQTIKQIRHWREQDALILPVGTSRPEYCAYCGKEFANQLTDKYFGEIFHFKCVDKMKRGVKND